MRVALPTIALLLVAWAFFAPQGAEDAHAQAPAPSADLRVAPTRVAPGQPVSVSLTVAHSSAAAENLVADLSVTIPNGWSVSSLGNAQSCAATCRSTYSIAPGQTRSIDLEAIPLHAATFTFQASVTWSMGDESGEAQAQPVEMQVVEPTPTPTPTPTQAPATGGEEQDDGGLGMIHLVGGLAGGSLIGIVLLGIFTNALSALLNLLTGKLFGSIRRRRGDSEQ